MFVEDGPKILDPVGGMECLAVEVRRVFANRDRSLGLGLPLGGGVRRDLGEERDVGFDGTTGEPGGENDRQGVHRAAPA
jgi:hypothetical protein